MKFNHSIIAHRGEMVARAENTLSAFKYALASGIKNIELDVQISSDGVPMVIHDWPLLRTTGRSGVVADLTADQLEKMRADHERPNERDFDLDDIAIPRLSTVLGLLAQASDVTVFVEIKRHSVEHFDEELVVNAVLEVLSRTSVAWVLISFEDEVLKRAKAVRPCVTGFIARAYDDEHLAKAMALSPDYVFCNKNKISESVVELWKGDWSWVIYDVMTNAEAIRWKCAGSTMLESGSPRALRLQLSEFDV